MKRPVTRRAVTVVAAVFSVGIIFGAPVHADPAVGNQSMIDMPMPGPAAASGLASSRSPSTYRPPMATMSEQDGDGSGVDPDGTNGQIDPDGTSGSITGPILRATPQVKAEPARKSRRDKS